MRHNARHHSTDPDLLRELVAEHPWATLVSSTPDGLVASHYPVLLDETDDLALVTHVGRPDEELHGFGTGEVMVVLQGHHGYVSPSWYAPGASRAPTWNFTAAHVHGVPQLLDAEDNLRVLTRLVAHFEARVDEPMWLDPEWGEKVARGTVGLRIPVDRFVLKVKHSQDKDPVSVASVVAHLRGDGAYAHPALADDLVRAHERGIGLS